MIEIFYGLFATFWFGLGNALSKKPIKEHSLFLVIEWRSLVSSSLLFIASLFFHAWKDFTWLLFWEMLGLGLLGYLALLSFYQGIKKASVGVIVTLANASSLVTILLALLFLHEPFTLSFFFALIFSFLGMLLLSYHPPFRLKKGALYGLLTFLLWGVLFFLLSFPARSSNIFLPAFFLEVSNLLWNSLYLMIKKEKKKEEHFFFLPLHHRLIILSLGLCIGLANLSYFAGIIKGAVSIMGLFTLGIPVIASMFSYWFWKEKLTRREVLGMLLVIVGLLLIS